MSRGLLLLWLVLSAFYIAIVSPRVYQNWQRVYYEENTYAHVGTRFVKLKNIDWNNDRCVPVGSKSQGLSPLWTEVATLCINFEANLKAGDNSLWKQAEARLRGVAPAPDTIYGFTNGGIDGKVVKVTKVAGQNPCPQHPDGAEWEEGISYFEPVKTSQGHIICVNLAQISVRASDLVEKAFKEQVGLDKIHKAVFYVAFLTPFLLALALLLATLFAGLWIARGFKTLQSDTCQPHKKRGSFTARPIEGIGEHHEGHDSHSRTKEELGVPAKIGLSFLTVVVWALTRGIVTDPATAMYLRPSVRWWLAMIINMGMMILIYYIWTRPQKKVMDLDMSSRS